MIVIITGADGMLGQALHEKISVAPSVDKILVYDIHDFDITNRDQIASAISSTGADVLINCAAYTDVERAEKEVELAMRVNCDGAGNLARACESAGMRMIHISTDYVFDGKKGEPYIESDPTSPVGSYGNSKREGELAVMKNCNNALIARTSWLYGPGGKNFASTIVKLAQKRDVIKVVNDQFGTPTFTQDMAGALIELIDTDAKGIVHVVNSGYCTWFDFACEIVKLTGIKGIAVEPCATNEFETLVQRPKNSRLDTSLLEKVLGRKLRRWDEGLKD
ncbi:dTDP-4-dehydrorhamnose reductase, partial [hydrothermal vent metagenome]